MTEAVPIPKNIFERLEDAPYGAYAIDLDQSLVFWNFEAERILGYRAEQVLGRKCYEVLQSLTVDGNTSVCGQNCPAVIAASQGRIHPVAYVQMLCASGARKLVTVMPLIATNKTDQPVLIHMFHETPDRDFAPEDGGSLPLTPRELEVLRLLALGFRPAEVAEQLFISVHTVRKHISNASEKLHSHGMMSAVLAAKRQRLI